MRYCICAARALHGTNQTQIQLASWNQMLRLQLKSKQPPSGGENERISKAWRHNIANPEATTVTKHHCINNTINAASLQYIELGERSFKQFATRLLPTWLLWSPKLNWCSLIAGSSWSSWRLLESFLQLAVPVNLDVSSACWAPAIGTWIAKWTVLSWLKVTIYWSCKVQMLKSKLD